MTTRTTDRFTVTETTGDGSRRVTPFRDRIAAQGYLRRTIARSEKTIAATITDGHSGVVVYRTGPTAEQATERFPEDGFQGLVTI